MKKIIIFISFLIILTAGIFIGFKIKDNVKQNNTGFVDGTRSDSNKVIDSTKKNLDVVLDNESKNTESTNETLNTLEATYTDKDNKVIDNLSNALEEIKNSEVTEKFKDSAKATFITLVDFLFYDGKIKGVTFKELTDSGKSKVLEIASKIDDAIEAKVPNYKDTISTKTKSAYNSASKLIKKGVSNLNDFMKEKLSEDNYNAIVDAKDDLIKYTKNAVNFIKDHGSNLFNEVKEALSAWYNRFKNN